MSGPQGSDANPWQASGHDQPATGAEQPSAAPEAPSWQPPGSEAPAWQPPAYPPQQYPQYGPPPAAPGYPPAAPYGAPPEYNPAAYGQPGQYPPPPQYGQPGPYGQPPQYGQYPPPPPGQFPPPGQPGQYPGYPQPGAEEASKKSVRALGTVLGVLAGLVLLVVLVTGFWKPGFFVTTKLDVDKAQQGVQQILTDESGGYGAKNVQDVKCNNGQNPTVKKGDTFTCEVSVDGTKRQVTVTFQDDKGTYEVGRPK